MRQREVSGQDVTQGQRESLGGVSKFLKRVTGTLTPRCRGEAQLRRKRAQPGTHPVSLGPSDASCSSLTGHPLQTWRALSPSGASWASCALRWERNLWRAALSLGTPGPEPPFLPFFLCPDPFLSHPPSLPPSIFIPPEPPPLPAQRTPASRTRLTHFGTISARSAREAAGPLEALGPGRATFPWETSFTLWQRHQGAVRQDRWGGGPKREETQDGWAGTGRQNHMGESRPKEAARKQRTGHSPWDPRGRELQLRQERPEEQRRMCARAEAFLSQILGRAALPLGAELRLSSVESWAAGPGHSLASWGSSCPLLPLPPGHEDRSSHLNRLQVQRAPNSPGHLVFHLHLGDRAGQEVPRSQSDLVRKGVRLLPRPAGRPAQCESRCRGGGSGKTRPRVPLKGALLLPQSPACGRSLNRTDPATYLEPRWPRSTLFASFPGRSLRRKTKTS